MEFRNLAELRQLMQGAIATLFGTAMLIVITLAVLKYDELDAPEKIAVHLFAWSAALLGAYLIMSVTAAMTALNKALLHKIFGYALEVFGVLTWLRGVYYILLHYRVPGYEIVFMQTIIVASIILVTLELLKAASDIDESLDRSRKERDLLKSLQSMIDARSNSLKDVSGEAEPNADTKGKGNH
jgi:hypothetical protein